MLGLIACSSENELENQESYYTSICFTYSIDPSIGTPMSRSVTNSNIFNEFYQKIKDGELSATNYDLTLTHVKTGAVQRVKGKWDDHIIVTLHTGTYHIEGTATAEGEYLQSRCSFTFDEQIQIDNTTSAVTLHAKYDCFLLIFSDTDIKSLKNFNGLSSSPLFTFSNYKYAFSNNRLYDDEQKDAAYLLGKYEDGTEFKIHTGNLNFEKGKYYVYNSITNGFDIPPMENGEIAKRQNVSTFVLDSYSQPILAGGYIEHYTSEAIKQKGIMVSKSSKTMFVDENTTFEKANILTETNGYSNDYPKDTRFIDCSDINKEEFICNLLYLEGDTDYYVRAFAITQKDSILYGDIKKIHTQDFDRYMGRADQANVYHAFEYTTFDLVTDEIIDPAAGFYYSTNQNPQEVSFQRGTSYNTCYKFASKWNYLLWYHHNILYCDEDKIVSIPTMTYENGKLTITESESDRDKDITIYYSVDNNADKPENFTQKYTDPLKVEKNSVVYCYAISSDGYMSYTNIYKIYK